MSGVTIRGGDASSAPGGNLGGGIRTAFLRSFTMTNVHITDNHSQDGGGAYLAADLVTLNRVTFSANTGSGGGLKLENTTSASATLSNVTFSGNTGAVGGGLRVSGPSVALNYVTITGNSAPTGSGIFVTSNGVVTPRATIIAGNTGGPNCAVRLNEGTITSGGFNIDSGTSCGFTAGAPSNDQNNANPSLGTLQNNGGQTPTHALSPGSVALDRVVTGACPSTDQRGISRPQDGDANGAAYCDVGAFEFRPQANIGVALSDSPDPVTVGSAITYTAQVSNAGPNTATGLVLTDVLPGTVSHLTSTTNVGSCSHASGTVTCNIGTLPSGGFANVQISVRTLQFGSVSNTATVTSATFDAATSNNTSRTTTTVNPNCTTRPAITQTVTRPGTGLLSVQLTAASTGGAPNNKIVSVRFLATDNATLEFPPTGGTGWSGAFTFPLTPAAQFTFLIRRSAAGAFTARYEVNDACGAYPLFAGGGDKVQ